MTIEKMLTQQVLEAVKACYGVELTEKDVQLQETRKEFAGDLTVVVFPFTRYSRKSPEETAKELGEYLKQNIEEVETYNVIKGFLNVVISSAYWIEVLNDVAKEENDLVDGGQITASDAKVQQGCIEGSNVNVVEEMVKMV